ncbi:hypothetical protein N0O92_23325, partial [Alkalihalobacillus sp. MEB130]|uniref:hypothetical protein n=1 Tax=Alkalihalobacillus sp. MEB130 TaxID=2976704 RepID=UPI0028DD96FA
MKTEQKPSEKEIHDISSIFSRRFIKNDEVSLAIHFELCSITKVMKLKHFYGEFDPGSGRTLAA